MARGLNVDLVVSAAIELADAEGLGAVTMAAVAERCGFTTMSLYRHVSGKDELMSRMFDTAAGVPPELPPDAGWRVGLATWAHGLLDVLAEHPWGIDIPITGVLGTRAQLAWLDRGLEAMADTGLHPGTAAEAILILNGYVFWSARLRESVTKEADIDVIPPAADLSDLPHVRRAVDAGAFADDTTHEEDFAYGLDVVLDGVAALIARDGRPVA
jgi:AcrR family transcriptional regulator